MFKITATRWLMLASAAALLPFATGCNHDAPAASTPANNTEPASSNMPDSSAVKPPADAAAMTPTANASAAAAAVDIKLFRFNPGTLTVAPNTTVTWTNEDDIDHTVTSGTPDAPSGPLKGDLPGKGKTFSYTFTTAGEYPYFCDQHHSMTGTVVVKAQ